MSWVILVRYGEISVKGRWTRRRLEKLLVENIADALQTHKLPYSKIAVSDGRIIITGYNSGEEALRPADVLWRVMGIVSFSPAYRTSFNGIDDLSLKATDFFVERLKGSTFAVRVRRVGKHDFTSLDVARRVGELILERVGREKLRVNLEYPEYEAFIEIRGETAYFYDKVFRGPGGLPIGSTGRVLSLFSGGIDSPVASWLMLKRGCLVDYVLFKIDGEEQVESVKKVAGFLGKMWSYGYRPKLYVVDVRKLLSRIFMHVPENYIVIVLRRAMMRLASMLADKIGAKALVTGESLGQVASQTLDNLVVIDEASYKTVLRPLIGMDKEEITGLARRIGTYEYSAHVREYCPAGSRKVTTSAKLSKAKMYEEKAGITDDLLAGIIEDAVEIDMRSIEIADTGESTKTSRVCRS